MHDNSPKMSWHDVQFLDHTQEIAVRHRQLPHWSQAGTLSFVTFRTSDSIPRGVLLGWLATRDRWLAEHGIKTDDSSWRMKLKALSPKLQEEYYRNVGDQWHGHLDDCHGRCVLRDSGIAHVVANSLLHFQGQRYLVTDF